MFRGRGSYSTGCTYGKWNIEKAGWGKLAFTLIDKKGQKAVRVSYLPGKHHKAVAESSFMAKRGQGISPTEIPEEEAWKMVSIIWHTPEHELLSIGDVQPYPWEEFGEIMGMMPSNSVASWFPKSICGQWERVICAFPAPVMSGKGMNGALHHPVIFSARFPTIGVGLNKLRFINFYQEV